MVHKKWVLMILIIDYKKKKTAANAMPVRCSYQMLPERNNLNFTPPLFWVTIQVQGEGVESEA